MEKRRSFAELIRHTCFKILWQFLICILILYILPLFTVSVDITAGSETNINDEISAVFMNVFSWIYICIALIAIVSINIRKMLKLIQREMDIVYHKSMWISRQDEGDEKLTLNELIETGNHIDRMRVRIQNMIEDEKRQKEELLLKVSSASHDLKTPLTVIQGNAEFLLYTQLDEKQRQCLEDISNAGNQMKNYINLLISYTKTFYDNKSEWETYTIEEVVKIVKQEVLFVLEDKSILTVVDNIGADRNRKIRLNMNYVVRAVCNIVNNACEYAKGKKKKIEIRIELEEDMLRFCIWNSGSSFSDEVLQNYGKLFYSKNKSRNVQSEHYGIGLAFVKRVAELHNGDLRLENGDGGAKVSLFIHCNAFEIRYNE